jgi:2-polyprenyl-3-methyl-5-hydroxy-6-metoxy-1,4-benzoquinol methylase
VTGEDLADQRVFGRDDREAFLRHVASSRPLVAKDDLIVSLCHGKTVLDVGCIDHDLAKGLEGQGDRWLHHRLSLVASELVGLDNVPSAAEVLNERGYKIVIGDAEQFQLDRSFDVVVAGDLIEHLSNPGLFLNSCRRHMHDHSILVVTTPNPFSAERSARAILQNRVSANRQHVCWIDPTVMFELVTRLGFRIRRFDWVETRFKQEFEKGGPAARALNHALRMVMEHRPVTRRDFAVVLSP